MKNLNNRLAFEFNKCYIIKGVTHRRRQKALL